MKRCATSGGCTYAREFSYSGWFEAGGERFTEKWLTRGSSEDSIADSTSVLVLDANGDGNDDTLYKDRSGRIAVRWGTSQLVLAFLNFVSDLGDMALAQPADIDGDGASEVVVMVHHGTREDIKEMDTYEEGQAFFRYEVWRWNEAAHDFEIVPDVLPANAATLAPDAFLDPRCRIGNAFTDCDHLFFADVNGDALPDIIKPWDDVIDSIYQPTRFEIYLNLGGTFGSPMELPLALAPNEQLAYHSWFHATGIDGRQYVRYLRFVPCVSCAPDYDTWVVGLRADRTPETFAHGDDPPHDGTTRLKPIDMDPDGDGVRELRWLSEDDAWYPSHIQPIRADIDGDGREDAVLHDTDDGTITVELSKTLADSPQPLFEQAQVLEHDRTLAKVFTGDFDGDGRLDIGGIESGAGGGIVVWQNIREWKSDGPPAYEVDLLTTVSDADHDLPREAVVYRNDTPTVGVFQNYPDSEPPLEAADCASYPVVCVRRGMTVVSEHAIYQPTHLPAASVRRRQYSYFYPYADAWGRGFLGFRMIRSWEPEQAVESEVYYGNTVRVGTTYPFAFVPARTLAATLLLDVEPGGRQAFPISSVRARVVRTDHEWEHRSLQDGATYAVNDERTLLFEWEEDVDVAWWSAALTPMKHIRRVDANPKLAPRQRTIDPTFDDYGNVIAQTATTRNGVRSEFTLDPKAADTYEWLVDLPEDYRFRSWTPSLHAAPPFRHVRFEHDPEGRLTTQRIEPTSTDGDIRQTIVYFRNPTYGSYGQVTGVSRTAPGGAGIRSIGVDWHDWSGEQIFASRVWNGLSHTTTYVHHPAYGVLVAEADPDGVETLYHHDDLGRPRVTEPQAGDRIEWTYREQPEHLEVTETSASGDVRATLFDALGRPVLRSVRGMDGGTKQMSLSYDVLGRPHTSSSWGDGAPALTATIQLHDTLGRPRFIERPDGTQVETEYAGLFEAIHHDAKRGKKRQIVDVDGRLIETYAVVEGTEVLSSSMVYKPFDLPGISRDADLNVIELSYDQLGRRVREDDPNAGATRLFYNGFGEVRRAERGTGTIDATVYHRDELGRVHTMDTADGVVTFGWDAAGGTGKLSNEISADGTVVSYRYDAAGRVRGSTWEKAGGVETFDLDVERDGHGRVVKTLYPEVDGQRLVIANVYEGAYVKSVEDATDPLNPKRLWTVTDRAADGALRAGKFGDALADYTASYDAMGQPTRLQTSRSPTDSLMDVEYTPDPNGNIERREDHLAGRVETFRYDELSRLRHWTNTAGATALTKSFEYDRIGNLEKVLDGATVLEEFVDRGAAGPQKLDHSSGGVTYQYDHRGRQIGAGTRTITYTAFDLPRQVRSGGAVVSSYQYTASGERFSGTDWTGLIETLYIGGLYERHTLGTRQTHVHHVHGPDGPVADIVLGAGDRRVSYVVPDALGSIAVRFDETLAPGAAPERFYYEPFGRRIEADGSAWAGSWGASAMTTGFAGVEHDGAGLINMGGRIYDPAQRRFVSPDPVVSDPYFDQAHHRYSYAHNNPTTLTDPTGYWVPPAWMCGNVSPIQLSAGSYAGGGPPSMLQTRTVLPDLTPDSYRTTTPAIPTSQLTGPGYAGGDEVARWLIDHGADAWLQQNGDAAINVSLGVSYVALSIATYGAAAEAGVFTGVGARVASFGASSWRTITGAAGVIGEGVRRYGTQLTRCGAQVTRTAADAGRVAPSAAREGAGAVIDPAKFNYLFGQATGRAHNIARTAQNAQQLDRIGIHNTAEGRAVLQSHLNQAVQGQGNMVQTFTNQQGTFEVRESLLAGPGGFLKIESTWQVMTDGARRFSTLIPMGG